jgi:hypothetical protein
MLIDIIGIELEPDHVASARYMPCSRQDKTLTCNGRFSRCKHPFLLPQRVLRIILICQLAVTLQRADW